MKPNPSINRTRYGKHRKPVSLNVRRLMLMVGSAKTNMKLFQRIVVLIAAVSVPLVLFAQSVPSTTSPPSMGWLGDIDTYPKVVGAVLTGLGTLFGLPIVILNFKKTRAEIRKLELEAAALESKAPVAGDVEGGTSIRIQDSDNVNVQVLADPRFLGPLLLLLDFILAWIVLTLAGYFLSFISLGIIRTALLAALAAELLIPIAREASRVRSVLRPKDQPIADHDGTQSARRRDA